MVAPVTGAPSDGNRQLYSGMRRALGSSKIVIVDAAGADVFTVVGNVNLTKIDEQRGQLVIKWLVKDPAGATSATSNSPTPCRLRRPRVPGPDSATLSRRRPRRACSNCWKRRSIGRVSEPYRALRVNLNRLVRGGPGTATVPASGSIFAKKAAQ